MMNTCSITSRLELVKADIAAYRALQRYHYCDGAIGPYCAVYALAERTGGAVVGVIVYAPSPLNNASRDRAAAGFFAGRPKSEKLALLNAHVRRISRVIIEPRYRGLGLAVRLVHDTLPLAGVAMVEASAAMGYLHPFFERAGMRAYAPGSDAARLAVCRALRKAGIDAGMWIDPPVVHERLCALTGSAHRSVQTAVEQFLKRFGRRRTMPAGLERTAFVLNRLGDPPRYFAWQNPHRHVSGLRLVSCR